MRKKEEESTLSPNPQGHSNERIHPKLTYSSNPQIFIEGPPYARQCSELGVGRMEL